MVRMADPKIDTECRDSNLEVDLVTAQAQAVGDLNLEIAVGHLADLYRPSDRHVLAAMDG
jgi:hypothetical protein